MAIDGDNIGEPRRFEVFSMTKIELSEEDADHIKRWQKLSDDEKDAINKIAKIFGSDDKRKSLYTLIEAQSKISDILAVHGHLSWAGRMFLKAGAIAGVLIALATAWKVYFGK